MRRRDLLAVAILLGPVAAGAPAAAEEASAEQPADNASGNAPGVPHPPGIPPPVIILKSHELEGILGKQVVSATGENMGRIVDVVVDRVGQVRAAVIDFGGFLGVGSRKIAVDWDALRFPSPGEKAGRVTLEFTRDQVKAAPEYQAGKPVVVLGAQGKLEPFTVQ